MKGDLTKLREVLNDKYQAVVIGSYTRTISWDEKIELYVYRASSKTGTDIWIEVLHDFGSEGMGVVIQSAITGHRLKMDSDIVQKAETNECDGQIQLRYGDLA